MKAFLPSIVVLSAISAIAAPNTGDEPKFETASVKRMERSIIHNSLGPGTVIMRGDPLNLILMAAFEVRAYQIVGPSWTPT